MTLWQLIQIELTDQQLLENVMAELLPRVDKTGGCHEFFLGLTLLLRQFRPSPKLLYTILTHFKANANSSYSTEQHLKAIEHPQTLPRHPQDTDKRFLRQVFLYWTSRSAYLDEISSAAATDSSSSSSSSSPSTPLSGPATPVWMPLEAAITSSLGMIRDDMFLLEAKQKASANRPDVLKQCSIQHQEFEDLFSNLITNLLYWKEVATELGFGKRGEWVTTGRGIGRLQDENVESNGLV